MEENDIKYILYEVFGLRQIIIFENEHTAKQWIEDMRCVGEESFKIIKIS